jgi:uncharacterized protein
MTPIDPLALADWRRAVAELYADVRREAPHSPQRAWNRFRTGRDRLFHEHSQSPLSREAGPGPFGLAYYPYDPAWRMKVPVERDVRRETVDVSLADDGVLRLTSVGRVTLERAGVAAALTLFWIEGYGGGLFLPFRDATSGRTTYGGGRYLYDTIKGADLGQGGGAEPNHIVLDFNFAYAPSCAYDPRWVCPLAPQENHLPFEVIAGERTG